MQENQERGDGEDGAGDGSIERTHWRLLEEDREMVLESWNGDLWDVGGGFGDFFMEVLVS